MGAQCQRRESGMDHKSRFAACLLCALGVSASVSGCTWDSSVYEQYVGNLGLYQCKGYCDTSSLKDGVTRESCTKADAEWNDEFHYCEIENAVQCAMVLGKAKTLSEALTMTETGDFWYERRGTELEGGRYIVRFANANDLATNASKRFKYVCGAYDYVTNPDNIPADSDDVSVLHGTCLDREIDELNALIKSGNCYANMQNCSSLIIGKEIISGPDNLHLVDGEGVAICSKCQKGQATCYSDGTAVNANCFNLKSSHDHCGTCSNKCADDQECIDGECTTFICSSGVVCRDASGERVCVDPTNRNTCGISTCEAYEKRFQEVRSGLSDKFSDVSDSDVKAWLACPRYADCAASGNSYACECSDKDDVVVLDPISRERRCVSPSSNTNCGATSESLGEACDTASGIYCQTNSTGKYVCKQYCEAGQLYCPSVSAAKNGCIDPNSDAFCGKSTECRNYEALEKGTAQSGEQRVARCDTAAGQRCTSGVCECSAGSKGENRVYCDQKCLDPMTDALHCGARGACNADSPNSKDYRGQSCKGLNANADEYEMTCVDGQCVCPKNMIFCGGRCVNPQTDVEYCGVTQDTCASNEYKKGNCHRYDGISSNTQARCSNSLCACMESSDASIQNVTRLDGNGQTYTRDQCVNLKNDASFCDDCRKKAASDVCNGTGGCAAGLICNDGHCMASSCRATEIECAITVDDGSNQKSVVHQCINPTQFHLASCETCQTGYCDNNENKEDGCPLLASEYHLAPSCNECATGWADSDDNYMNGCDIDLLTNPLHCGAVGNNCYENFYAGDRADKIHAEIQCMGGQCVIGDCWTGYADCDNEPGCEALIMSDAMNCGKCQNACVDERLACYQGKCETCVVDGEYSYHESKLGMCCHKRFQCESAYTQTSYFWQCDLESPYGYHCKEVENAKP